MKNLSLKAAALVLSVVFGVMQASAATIYSELFYEEEIHPDYVAEEQMLSNYMEGSSGKLFEIWETAENIYYDELDEYFMDPVEIALYQLFDDNEYLDIEEDSHCSLIFGEETNELPDLYSEGIMAFLLNN